MIQGKTKIQLFDSNGNLENEIVEKNMVTNALQYLVSPDVCMLSENTINSLIKDSMPFYSNALGGVMLFDENIEENAETVFKPNSVNIVGHAGSVYSGTNVMRGSYNVNESGELKDDNLQRIGYRHVWDFGTDKGNGTIKCLSLTSLNGGNNAFSPAYMDCTKKNNHTLYSNSIMGMYGKFLGQIDGSTIARLIYGTKDGQTGFHLLHTQFSPRKGITIFENAGSCKETMFKYLNISTQLSNNSYGLYAAVPDKDGFAYICSVNSSGVVTYSKFSIITGDVNDGTANIAVPDGYSLITPYCIIFGNRIVLTLKNSSDNLYYPAFYDLQGNLIRVETRGGIGGAFMYAEADNGRLYLSDTYNYVYVFENEYYKAEEQAFSSRYWGGSQYKYKNGIYNFTAGMGVGVDGYSNMYVTRRDDYIATINNLATPVVKTNAQTMKITYDIMEV